MIRVGIGQMEPKIAESEENIDQLRIILREAKMKGVEVLVLPELANSGYAFKSIEEAKSSAEGIPEGDFSKVLRDWSKEQRLVAAGICEKCMNEIYNSAAVFANGEHLATYRKVHLFNEEKTWFQAGRVEPPVVKFQSHTFGIMICWDWIFPEMSRILALKGAQAILHPSNLVLEYCQNVMRTRSLENGVFSITSNRIGVERGLAFSGKSQIVDPKGSVLLSMPDLVTGVQFVDLDLTEADDKMLTPRNHRLDDRKPSLYKRLIESF